MDKSKYNIQFQSEGTQNYIVVDLPVGTEVIGYCRKVLEKNKIPGLLMSNYQFLNGEIRLKYSINGKRGIRELVQSGSTNEKNELLILSNLIHALKNLNTYLIDLDKIWLDPKYLYIGDGMNVFMVCVPVEDNTPVDISQNLKHFFLELLSDYLGSGNNRYSDMFMWVYKQSIFDLELFEQEFLNKRNDDVNTSESHSNVSVERNYKHVQGVYQESKLSYSVPQVQREETPKVNSNGQVDIKKEKAGPFGFNFGKQKKESDPNPMFPIPGNGMKTPGGEAINIPGVKPREASDERVEPKDNKKNGAGLFGRKKYSHPVEDYNQSDIIPYIVHKGCKIEICKTPFAIGQGSSSYPVDYVIKNNPRVSHRHAVIIEENGEFYLSDNCSTNGTILNGIDVKPGTLELLKDGDEIRLYNEIICFYLT
jgi:hypothetical protein rflaF_01939